MSSWKYKKVISCKPEIIHGDFYLFHTFNNWSRHRGVLTHCQEGCSNRKWQQSTPNGLLAKHLLHRLGFAIHSAILQSKCLMSSFQRQKNINEFGSHLHLRGFSFLIGFSDWNVLPSGLWVGALIKHNFEGILGHVYIMSKIDYWITKNKRCPEKRWIISKWKVILLQLLKVVQMTG